MSLTVQQLLSDAKRLSSRLRDHDQSADHLISRAQEVLKEVDAMRQYQEDVENLNEVAHNRPRAQLVLGIQQENRHIRTLQQENKELRAALEEHQNALELIMSKYRQHVTRLVNTPHPDVHTINNQKIQMLAERTEKVCEMAAVMKEAVRVDEDTCNQQQELMARLITENKGLRELLEISQKSNSSPRVKKVVSNVHKEVQTDNVTTLVEQVVSVTLPMPTQPRPPPRSPKIAAEKKIKVEPVEQVDTVESPDCGVAELSSGDSDETGSEDESIKYDTIKLADRRNKNVAAKQIVKTIDTTKTTEAGKESPTEVKAENQTSSIKTEENVVTISNAVIDSTASIVVKAVTPEPSIIVKAVTPAPLISTDNPCTVIKSTPDKSITVQIIPTPAPPLTTVQIIPTPAPPLTTVQIIPSPAPPLTEGQQNQVIVDSLVQQLVRDSVETSTEASSIITDTVQTKTAAIDNSSTLTTTDSTTTSKPTPEPVKQTTADSEPSKPSPPPGDPEQPSPANPSPSSTTSPKQPAKSANTSKTESPSRGNSKGKNNKKSDNKGNKNSPKKGNKK
eukprot:GFUD01040428.1.p1 GENE.GFUD01040428.1~~GFUD01040428.1.p1  ORF type:complete len:563 (+),score=227.84 GFUD01040428.1:177-1865(+)